MFRSINNVSIVVYLFDKLKSQKDLGNNKDRMRNLTVRHS